MRLTHCRTCMNAANLALDDGPVYGLIVNQVYVPFCSNECGDEYIRQFQLTPSVPARSAGGEATQTQGNPPPAPKERYE